MLKQYNQTVTGWFSFLFCLIYTARYEVKIRGIDEDLKDKFYFKAFRLCIEKPHRMKNKDYTFFAVFKDQDGNSIDARYYGGRLAAMTHYKTLKGSDEDGEFWFKISNVEVEGEEKIKGKKDADHHCRIRIKSTSRFVPIEAPREVRNPLGEIQNEIAVN